ncbi:VPLPA-CTERM sorting domain-containing protein [Primorskyibacter sp. 2E107]|uniref:VPLPA-CTERM sorting domain-containing protein n=1 Tax=Primorskyibacter sp. 2E107 TaxID=3403458 RepID=UPI003AF6DFCA
MTLKYWAITTAATTAVFMAGASSAATITAFDAAGNTLVGVGGSVNVAESVVGSTGTYNVSNGITGAGRADLLGFGVSNIDTIPTLNGGFGGSCANATTNPDYSQICYNTMAITAANWATETVETSYGEATFQEVFGSFASVAGTDTVFNYFYAEDGSLGSGGSIANFFGFQGIATASSIIGAFESNTGVGYFTAGAAAAPEVPLPAAGWMLIVGLGGLAAARRRKA